MMLTRKKRSREKKRMMKRNEQPIRRKSHELAEN
jgi:hypothetical protein